MVPARRFSLLLFFLVCCIPLASIASSASDLTDALKSRDVARVRSLVASGADVNEKVRGDYPLNIAAVYGPTEMVSILIGSGADIEKPGRDGLRPLHNAVISGRKDIVTVLIDKGAKANSRDSQGRTPLLWFAAIAGNDIQIAKVLLAAGADPRIEETVDQLQPLDFAAINGAVELAKILISNGVDVNHPQDGFWGETALMHAIFHDRVNMVQLLVAHGANVNLANKKGESPLHYAKGKAELQRVLVEAGAK